MQIPLTGGAYKSRSLIAAAQRSVNLYLEENPPASQAPFPFTLYPRAGLRRLATPTQIGIGRGLYADSRGNLYAVVGQIVYYVDPNFGMTQIGQIDLGTSICSMADNGTQVLLVDGTAKGYTIDIASKIFNQISDPAFYGGDRVVYVQTVFALNRPGTNQWYISGSNALTWDSLDFGQKTSSADPLVAVAALNNYVWLLGTLAGEVWYFSGDGQFPWQIQPGVTIMHGLAAKWSLCGTDAALFWITQDRDGPPWVAMGTTDYSVKRISTHAIEYEIQNYARWDDCVGTIYQKLGHTFVVLHFPSANKTWCWDVENGEWNQWSSVDPTGTHNRWKMMLAQYAYKTNVGLDWQRGFVYAIDDNYVYDDDGPIVCVRGFPHLTKSRFNRASYPGFVADMQTGTVRNQMAVPFLQPGSPFSSGFSSGFGPFAAQNVPSVRLRISRDRGYTFGNPRTKSLGTTGQASLMLKWLLGGMSRDIVYELEWMQLTRTALNGAYLMPPEEAET